MQYYVSRIDRYFYIYTKILLSLTRLSQPNLIFIAVPQKVVDFALRICQRLSVTSIVG